MWTLFKHSFIIISFHFIVALSFFLPISLAASPPDEIVLLVQNMNKLSNFKANIKIQVNESNLSGVIQYDKGKTNLTLDNGNVLAVNNIHLVAYDSMTQVAGQQAVASQTKSRGLNWLLKGFTYTQLGPRHWKGIRSEIPKTKSSKLSKFYKKEIEVKCNEKFYLEDLKIINWDASQELESIFRVKFNKYCFWHTFFTSNFFI